MPYRKKILVVEDNDLNRQILCAILSDDYRVIEAENGLIALQLLRQHKDSISLVLLDVMMPVMDGYTFLDRVREDLELSTIPVIVTTQGNSEEDELNALNHGATDFVPKPYRPQVILNRAAALINLRENAAMVSQLQFDRLTGLYSREFFYEKVRSTLREDPETDYVIVCTNIENFKLINDVFGTQEGDNLLKEIAQLFMKKVGSSGFCGRFNADRLLCLQRRDQIELDNRYFGLDDLPGVSPQLKRVVIRWGVYEITDRSVPVEQMCDRALLAVDSIKNRYDRFFALFDDSLIQQLLREQTLTSAMEAALNEEQFVVYLQPQYSLRDNCMVGAEALVRWIHPEMGFISPGEFIPLFERNGFISKLDRYVWERVCQTMQKWKKQGEIFMPLSVNISRADVFQPDMVDTLLSLLKTYDIAPQELHLEITESAYVDNQATVIAAVEELRRHGFVLEMDDFGSGYSSLNMLSQMSLDVLKLDMKFIQNEISKPSERSLLTGIIEMAHWAQLDVVAEGVETREQMNRLREVGCDYAQGYFFSKPLPLAEFEKLLKEQQPQLNHSSSNSWSESSRKTLLVVDESAGFRAKVRDAFSEQYQVLEVDSKAESIRLLQSEEMDSVCAMVLSLTLPDNGSMEVMNLVNKSPVLWDIPVLATVPNGECVNNFPMAFEMDDFLCKCHPVQDMHRRVQRLIDMSIFRKRFYILQEEASCDPLTGMLNRRSFDAAMASIRTSDMPLALCIFDLDEMKMVNDTFGHTQGDRMIRSFADLLCRMTRREDIKCRYGGDEFVLIMKNLPSGEVAMNKVSSICDSFQDDAVGEGMRYTCSAGVVMCLPGEKLSIEHINRADQALYCAKRENKGGCCLWENGMAV